MEAGEDLGAVERRLVEAGIGVVRERFRLPAHRRITPVAGHLSCAAGGFLLAAGGAAASFLLSVAGAVALLLDACGFSPLNWLGPKEKRCVLVVRGTPAGERTGAFFFGLPLRCRLTRTGHFSRAETIRRMGHAAGLALAFLVCAASGAVLLVYLPPLPVFGGVAGTVSLVLAAAEWTLPGPCTGPPNIAASWADRLAAPADAPFRPYLLVYSGDGAEVSYFLARHRGALLRGNGVFLEFSAEAEGPPAATVGEGPLLPYRVDAGLLSLVRRAGESSGIPRIADRTLRFKSAGLYAMARGFRAVTLFRPEPPSRPESPFSAEAAFGWAAEIARAAGDASPPDLTESGKKV